MAVTSTDRLTLLRTDANQEQFTVIDFVHVVDPCDQTKLHIFFVTDLTELDTSRTFTSAGELLANEDIFIHSATDPNLPRIRVTDIAAPGGNQAQLNTDLGRSFMEITLEKPGDFGNYRLRIDDPIAVPGTVFSRIDPVFNDVEFSFKVACDTILDCAEPPVECPPEDAIDFPVDYLARDFVSLRNALLDFATQRYPQWAFPLVPDVGMMVAEVFAALGDEFSYIQDRHAREAHLQTADQRRTLRKKARLLDYEIHDGRSAATFLDLIVDDALFPELDDDEIPEEEDPPSIDVVEAGQNVWAPAEGRAPVPFEIGLGLHDLDEQNRPTRYPVRPEWNRGVLQLYALDVDQICLQVGATELLVAGPVFQKQLLVNDGRPRRMLLQLDPKNPGVAQRRLLVRITDISDEIADPLNPTAGFTYTRITWDARDALPFQLDQNDLTISLNIVPATAGETLTAEFFTGSDAETPVGALLATEREGPLALNSSARPPIFLFGLPEAETQGLGFLGEALRSTTPEVRLARSTNDDDVFDEPWTFQRTLLGSSPSDAVFTLEDGTWRAIRTFRRLGVEFVHQDYASNDGFSLRFGDGEFGRIAPRGGKFQVSYRTGPGVRANVPADAVNGMFINTPNDNPLDDRPKELPDYVSAITNPLPVTTGVDPESPEEIKLLVPEAYQADVLFAVRPEDYGEQAEKLDFVQRAHGTQRWTGSWSTMFVAADPFGSSVLTDTNRDLLEGWMDCVRQAGRDVTVVDPITLSLDLIILLCIEPFAHPGQILPLVEEVLLGKGQGRRVKGFFHPDNFTFGTPLRRSALEAVIQRIPGVRSVRDMRIRERSVRSFRPFTELLLTVTEKQVIRLDNDPLRPENGTLEIRMEGGA